MDIVSDDKKRVGKNMKINKLVILATILLVVMLSGCGKDAAESMSAPSLDVEEFEAVEVNEIVVENNISQSDNFTAKDENVQEEAENTDNDESVSADSEEAPPVDLIFFMGQSNMAGYGGDARQAPEVPIEAGEEFRAISDPTRLYKITEPFGINECNENGLSDFKERRKGTLTSAFVNKYYEETGRKVIAVSNSVGGMAMDLWIADAFWKDSLDRINTSIKWLEDNNYNVGHIYMCWMQGESDAAREVEPEHYKKDFYTFMDSLLECGIEQIFLIVPRRYEDGDCRIHDLQENICEVDDNFTLGTTVATDLGGDYQVDGIHFNQEALNIIGEETAASVARYTNNH